MYVVKMPPAVMWMIGGEGSLAEANVQLSNDIDFDYGVKWREYLHTV